MHIKCRNVNDAFRQLVSGIHSKSIPTRRCSSRYGDVMMIDEPVILTYEKPLECVLFNPGRDANPLFHIMEALWMLAGRNDVAPLAYYNKRMTEFSDDGLTFNGAYGYRWRPTGFVSDGDVGKKGKWHHHGHPEAVRRGGDQLSRSINHLRHKPDSRRAVLQMWNIEDDLLNIDESKDVCCNLSACFSIRQEIPSVFSYAFERSPVEKYQYLDMTVFNRSNDLVWGMLGANAVHFAFLAEYVAAHLGVQVGVYSQVTNNLHCYLKTWEPEKWLADYGQGGSWSHEWYASGNYQRVPLIHDPKVFDAELPDFVEHNYGAHDDLGTVLPLDNWTEPFLVTVAQPLCNAFHRYKADDLTGALGWANSIRADDWRMAARGWLERRVERRASRAIPASAH